MKKKHDKTTDGHTKRYFGGWMSPGTFAPVSTHDPYAHSRRPFVPQLPSLRERFTAWIRYYSIQVRWDVERWLARKLHRRWS
jgi:hypothetical protein